jgi:hypothetical protein
MISGIGSPGMFMALKNTFRGFSSLDESSQLF